MYDLYSGLESRDTFEDRCRKNNGRLPEGPLGRESQAADMGKKVNSSNCGTNTEKEQKWTGH